MASSAGRPDLSNPEEGCDEVFFESLVWAWVPAEDELPEVWCLKQDGETEPWVSWDLDGGEISSEERRPDTASGWDASSASWDGY